MKRLVSLTCLLVALALPEAASARVIELGAGAEPARSNCPNNPCEAIGRVTGYQGRSGSVRNPFVIRRDGVIVAFTLQLPRMTPQQMQFFNNFYGGEPSVRLAILRKGRRRRTRLDHRLIRQSRIYQTRQYFGSNPTFALDRPLRVRRRHIVALTVPTWTAYAYTNLSARNWWRASRPRGQCRRSPPPPAIQRRVGRVVMYGCTYFRARLLYTVTYIPDPQPTDASR